MASDRLDDVDHAILYLLQENARTSTTSEIGEKVGVSASTVGNRINKLEARGVITGYHPTVDYEQTGLDHHLLVVGTVPFEEREAVGDDVMEVPGVVCLRELLSSNANVTIEVVGRTRRDVEQTLSELHSVGVDIERTEMMKRQRRQPYDHYGKQYVDDE